MLDPTETRRSLREAAGLLEPLAAGKPVHPSTLHRWATRGLRGVRLATVRVGARRFTTLSALRDFLAAFNEAPTR